MVMHGRGTVWFLVNKEGSCRRVTTLLDFRTNTIFSLHEL